MSQLHYDGKLVAEVAKRHGLSQKQAFEKALSIGLRKLAATPNGVLQTKKAKPKRRTLERSARSAKRFTTARDAIAYLEREAGI